MKIMFICTGNICRSAMAHAMFEKMVKEQNKNVQVYSCGIYAQNGDIPTYEAIETMNEYGINLRNHRATNIRRSRIKEMDIILCATESHKQSVLHMYPKLKEKVFTMKEYAKLDNNGQDMDIKDPWGYDMNVYQNCAREIEECNEKIIYLLRK